MITIYVSGEATLFGSLKVLELSDSPFAARRSDRIYTSIEGTRSDYAAAAAELANGESFYL